MGVIHVLGLLSQEGLKSEGPSNAIGRCIKKRKSIGEHVRKLGDSIREYASKYTCIYLEQCATPCCDAVNM
jgi:hypothetical protein